MKSKSINNVVRKYLGYFMKLSTVKRVAVSFGLFISLSALFQNCSPLSTTDSPNSSLDQSANAVAPPTIQEINYSVNPATYIVNKPISNNIVRSTGGTPTTFSVTPNLPMGLVMDPNTGIISGTPTSAKAATKYTVSASNLSGTVKYVLSISVVVESPQNLTYASNPVSYVAGSAVTPNTPGFSGGMPTSYTVSPSLPQGMSLNSTTGVISGTPAAAQAALNYMITASNSSGSTTISLNLAITAALLAPTNLSYSNNSAAYPLNTAINYNSPTSSGGSPTFYSVNPGLPLGLMLNSMTGVISGTPTVAQAATNYTITASNSTGSTTKVVNISVILESPRNLIYANSPVIYMTNTAITDNLPSFSGGTPTSYTVNPSLPLGLSLNSMTGVISGSPTVAQAATDYTISASNTNGSTTAVVRIAVNLARPVGLNYIINKAVYAVGQIIPSNVPSNNGGAITSYSVSPDLPEGLLLNTSTGIISGKPVRDSGTSNYRVTSSNSAGSVDAVLTLSVYNMDGLPATNYGIYHDSQHCVVQSGGLTCWGDGKNPYVFNNLNPNQVFAINSGVQAVSMGENYTCALVNDGVQCWGYNASRLGRGVGNTDASVRTPGPVVGLSTEVQSIVTGKWHACAIVNDGVKCWGNNTYGQLGDGTKNESWVPVQVEGLTSGVQSIAIADEYTCAVVNGGVKCWGRDTYKLLENIGAPPKEYLVPTALTALSSGVRSIATGFNHACAIVNEGVKCWGGNYYGQLGNGTTSTFLTTTPVLVAGTSGVQSVSLGRYATCAVINGAAKCWGIGDIGQLGGPPTSSQNLVPMSSVPVQVTGLTSGVKGLSHGYDRAFALTSNTTGPVWVWGLKLTGTTSQGLKYTEAFPNPQPL